MTAHQVAPDLFQRDRALRFAVERRAEARAGAFLAFAFIAGFRFAVVFVAMWPPSLNAGQIACDAQRITDRFGRQMSSAAPGSGEPTLQHLAAVTRRVPNEFLTSEKGD